MNNGDVSARRKIHQNKYMTPILIFQSLVHFQSTLSFRLQERLYFLPLEQIDFMSMKDICPKSSHQTITSDELYLIPDRLKVI